MPQGRIQGWGNLAMASILFVFRIYDNELVANRFQHDFMTEIAKEAPWYFRILERHFMKWVLLAS